MSVGCSCVQTADGFHQALQTPTVASSLGHWTLCGSCACGLRTPPRFLALCGQEWCHCVKSSASQKLQSTKTERRLEHSHLGAVAELWHWASQTRGPSAPERWAGPRCPSGCVWGWPGGRAGTALDAGGPSPSSRLRAAPGTAAVP